METIITEGSATNVVTKFNSGVLDNAKPERKFKVKSMVLVELECLSDSSQVSEATESVMRSLSFVQNPYISKIECEVLPLTVEAA